MRSVVGQKQAVASQREPVGRRVVLHAVGAAVLLLTEEQTVASQRDDRILHQPSVAERVVIDEHPVGCRTDAAQGGRERSLCCEPGPADAVAVELFFERGDVLHHLLTAAYVVAQSRDDGIHFFHHESCFLRFVILR